MTYLLKKQFQRYGSPLFTNYHLRGGLPFTYMECQDMIAWSKIKKAKDGTNLGPMVDLQRAAIGLDEVHTWADSRVSGRQQNRVFSYLMLQSSKDDVNIYWTSQREGQVDKRLRQQTDIWITVQKYGDLHLCAVQDLTAPTPSVSRLVIKGKTVWDFFDTREKVIPPELQEAES